MVSSDAVIGRIDLDQLHHRRRVEEVDAADQFRAGRRHREFDDRKRRGVGREDRSGLGDAVEFGEERRLHGEILDDRLDHQIAVGEVAEVGGGGDPAEDRSAFVSFEAALVDLAFEALGELGDRRLGAVLGA